MTDITGIYNTSAYDGTIVSDFLSKGILSPQIKEGKIDYSSADFTEFRTSLLDYLKAVYPHEFNNFVESDLGVMLVEMFAYLASVLSLKADMLANESYLPSVQSPENLRKLLQLIGVSLKGPISSRASCLLTLNTADTLADGTGIQIALADRTFSIPSSKDTGMLSYTMYEVNSSTGAIDMTSDVMTLTKSESDSGSGATFSNIILLEGQLKTLNGTLPSTTTNHSITITDSSITEGSLIASINGVRYNEIQNLFLADKTDKVFSKTYLDDYSVVLTFGDDVRGKSPSPNEDYTIYYRVGGGDRGNVVPQAIQTSIPITLSDASVSECSITNPTKATGGLKSESVAHAKKWAPYFFKTQYRAVTGEDYTTFANQFVSTAGTAAKALATLRNSGAGSNMIDIYIVAFAAAVEGSNVQVERASIAYKNELLTYLNTYKMITDEVSIVDGLIRTLDIKATIYIDTTFQPFEEDIKRAAAGAILNYFDVSNREFGERLRVDELNRVLFEIPEIRFSKLDNIPSDIKLNYNEILQLNNVELSVEYV
tara:strand:- start:3579 stop:5201 length:1623 start_codon:yes stop_codon:yes gene_type:complete